MHLTRSVPRFTCFQVAQSVLSEPQSDLTTYQFDLGTSLTTYPLKAVSSQREAFLDEQHSLIMCVISQIYGLLGNLTNLRLHRL